MRRVPRSLVAHSLHHTHNSQRRLALGHGATILDQTPQRARPEDSSFTMNPPAKPPLPSPLPLRDLLGAELVDRAGAR
jgi:hypothetical protein